MQRETVIKIMEKNGGYATLGLLNQHAVRVPGVDSKAEDPFRRLRQVLQDEDFFFMIRPGLWALRSSKSRLSPGLFPKRRRAGSEELGTDHAYYQGLLIEIGNLRQLDTFIPPKDRSSTFLRKRLGDAASLPIIHEFASEEFVRVAETIDVSWFNRRQMPTSFFEVDDLTPMIRSLLSFLELEGIAASFFMVASEARRSGFQSKLAFKAFESISRRVGFLSFEEVAELHAKECEIASRRGKLGTRAQG
jgi:hypothetical protein